jgi:hypothetical protein
MNKLTGLATAALVTIFLSTAAYAEDLKFDLVNNSSYTVTNFFTSPTTTDTWEEDVLGQDTLGPDESVAITIGDGSDQCVYDMKFSAKGADDLVIKGIDICKLDGNRYTLTDAQ